LLHRPQVLFLDEPTLGLDVNAQVAVREFLREYNRRYQATIMLTSHYMADITALCDRVLLIYQGQLIYDGLLDGLLDRFAPYRQVTVELDQGCSAEILSRYGELESLEGCVASLIVRREDLTKTVSNLLNDLVIHDLTVTDPPIEEVIGRVFQSGKVL
ncbi:ABC transporter, partial [filamentous cyanobacterium CCP5]